MSSCLSKRILAVALLVSTAIPSALVSQASAQSASPPDSEGMILFRRAPSNLNTKALSPLSPLSPLSQQGLSGDSFGWYAYCYKDVAYAACFSFPDNGGTLANVDPSNCADAQDKLHVDYMASQSTRYFGDSSFLQPAGAPPKMPACAGDTTGHGYQCSASSPSYMSCYTIDRDTYVLSSAERESCLIANDGDYSKALSLNGLNAPGPDVDPATACQGGPTFFYGRTESCSWIAAPDGSRSLRSDETCYGVDSRDFSVREVPLNYCQDYAVSAVDSPKVNSWLKQAGLLKARDAKSINCGGSDPAKLTSKIVSDTTVTGEDGRLTRTIDYSFTCLVGTRAVESSSCSGAIVAWTTQSAKFAADNGLGLEVVPGYLTKREIYSEF